MLNGILINIWFLWCFMLVTIRFDSEESKLLEERRKLLASFKKWCEDYKNGHS